MNSTQAVERDQGLIQAYLPKFHFLGSHQFQVGRDVDWLHYNADFSRTGYQVLGLPAAGEPAPLISETLFPAPAGFQVGDTEVSAFLLDTWRVSKRLQFNLGIREDWDRKIDALAWSPRAAFSWSPFASGRTRISGGYSITHDAVTMDMLGRPLDQTAVTTHYNSDRHARRTSRAHHLHHRQCRPGLCRAPANWTLDVDHQLSTHVYLTAKYLRRRGTDGFAFINTLAPDAPPSLLPLPSADSAGDLSAHESSPRQL